MAVYTVQVTNKTLGITLDSANNAESAIIVSDVAENSIGDKLGINIGDEFIAINDVSMSDITASSQYASKDIQYILYDQKIPFSATFQKSQNLYLQNNYQFIKTVIYNINSESESESTVSTLIGDEHEARTSIYSLDTQIAAYHGIVQTAKKLSTAHAYDYDYMETLDNKCSDEVIDSGTNPYIVQDKCMLFDKVITSSRNKICLLSSQGLTHGHHKWIIKILKCDVGRQEIGVIGTADIENIDINENGIKDTREFGARSIYGNETCTDSVYYGSYNKDGSKRCYRDLNRKRYIQWNAGDTVKVCIDLDKWRIKYFLNNEKVRKPMSLEKKMYYPVIYFEGNSVYEFISFE